MSIKLRRLMIVLLVASPLVAHAASVIHIAKAFIPPSHGTTGVAYLTIVSDRKDAITGAESSCCSAVELHMHEMQGDVMRMRRVENVPLPAGKPVFFAPHALHVMLIGLKAPLQAGDHVAIALHFAHAPDQVVDFPVDAAPLQDEHQSPMHMPM